jgi:hypothetical protein
MYAYWCTSSKKKTKPDSRRPNPVKLLHGPEPPEHCTVIKSKREKTQFRPSSPTTSALKKKYHGEQKTLLKILDRCTQPLKKNLKLLKLLEK